jgi:hypothetical protein
MKIIIEDAGVFEFIYIHSLFNIIEIIDNIQKYFKDTDVKLELTNTPKNSSPPQLIMKIQTQLPPTKALQTLELFDSEYWCKQDKYLLMKVLITLY